MQTGGDELVTEAEGIWWTDWGWLKEWKVAARRAGDAACIISLL